MNFTLANTVNPNKVFLIRKSELEKRLDAEYYTPSSVALEKKVLAKNPKKLREFVLGIASGATPKTTESELYYTDKENGKPFLRVQNLSPTGELQFEDCKYINHETHNVMLKRSQVSAGDLLVKITGVGRMAVASVAPEGFEGNINQHICVIKTGSREVSETLAAFLNSDIGEKLASRRSTGGTRPALDYPALLSIPVLYDKRVLEISKKVVEQKTKNEAAAETLLKSIDDYLLKELGITLPNPPENNLKNRIFFQSLKEISGQRIDPIFHRIYYQEFFAAIKKSKYPLRKHKSLLKFIDYGLMPTQDYAFTEKDGLPMIRVTNIKQEGYIDMEDVKYIKFDTPKLYDKLVKTDDILMVQCGNTTGKCAMVTKEHEGFTYGSFSFAIRANEKLITQNFLYNVLNSKIVQEQLNRSITVTSVRPNTSKPEVEEFLIPVPPIEKQKEIEDFITGIRKQAQALKDKTKEALKKASEEIEEILIGK